MRMMLWCNAERGGSKSDVVFLSVLLSWLCQIVLIMQTGGVGFVSAVHTDVVDVGVDHHVRLGEVLAHDDALAAAVLPISTLCSMSAAL